MTTATAAKIANIPNAVISTANTTARVDGTCVFVADGVPRASSGDRALWLKAERHKATAKTPKKVDEYI